MALVGKGNKSPDNVTDLLVCSVCMERYDDDAHQPKLLPCHHSFCTMCLIHLASTHSYIDCPTCRKRTILGNLAPEGVNQLQTNFYINQMRELIGSNSTVKNKGCKRHSKPFTCFCQSCNTEICSECSNTDHSQNEGHIVQDLTKARSEQKLLLETEIAEAQETSMKAKPRVKTLQAEKGCLFAAKNSVEACIDASYYRLQEALKTRREQLISELKSVFTVKSHDIDRQMEFYNGQVAKLENLIDDCSEVLSSTSITEILNMRTALQTRNQDFRNRENYPQSENFIQFDPVNDGNHALDAINNWGSVVVSSSLPAIVKAFEQPVVAGLFSTMSLEVKNISGQSLPCYPIQVKIQDIYDDPVHCITKHRTGGRYEVVFKPMISGIHRVKVLFLDHVIDGSEFNLNVLSNNPVSCFGSKGALDSEMAYPRDLAVTTDGHVFVMDTGNNRIQVFTQIGEFQYSFPISEESERFTSCGIAYNKEQNTILCPEVEMHEANMVKANNLLVFSLDGQLLQRMHFKDTLSKGLSVAINSMGHIIVGDYELHCVFIFDKPGRRLLKKFGEHGSGPGQFIHPTFVCIGEDDSIIVSDGDNNRLQVFDKKGKYQHAFGQKGNAKGEFNMPFGVTCDFHGNILVADGGNKRIQIFKKDGEFCGCIESLGNKMNAPRGIGVTSDGYVLVADRDNHCVKRYKYLQSAHM